jgi:hypothetical protein
MALVLSYMKLQAFQVLDVDSSHSLQVVQWCKWLESKVKGSGHKVTYNQYVLVLEVRNMQNALIRKSAKKSTIKADLNGSVCCVDKRSTASTDGINSS